MGMASGRCFSHLKWQQHPHLSLNDNNTPSWGQFQKLRNYQRPCHPFRLARRFRLLFLRLKRSRGRNGESLRVSLIVVAMSTFSGDETVLVFSCELPIPPPSLSLHRNSWWFHLLVSFAGKGSAYGMASMGVTRPEPVMKSIMLVVSARDLRIDYRCDHKHRE